MIETAAGRGPGRGRNPNWHRDNVPDVMLAAIKRETDKGKPYPAWVIKLLASPKFNAKVKRSLARARGESPAVPTTETAMAHPLSDTSAMAMAKVRNAHLDNRMHDLRRRIERMRLA